jgi:hypothetical protein
VSLYDVWLTYAWSNNQDGQIDYVVAELQAQGLAVGHDRAHLIPGQRLWEQLDRAITSDTSVAAWAWYITKESLESEPCREELAIALDRALRTKTGTFPLIGIFPSPIARDLIPSAIATRLYVNLNDPNWAKQVAAGVRKTRPDVGAVPAANYVLTEHAHRSQYVLELRPRAGRWYPCTILVPESQRANLVRVVVAPSGGPAPDAPMWYEKRTPSVQGYSGLVTSEAVDHLHSAYVFFKEKPKTVVFGQSPNMTIHTSEALPPGAIPIG